MLATPNTLFNVNDDVYSSNLAIYNREVVHQIIQNGKYTEREDLREPAAAHLFGRVVKGASGDPILLFDFRLVDSW